MGGRLIIAMERSEGETEDHPMTQGKIVRWHQTLKNCIPIEHYFLPCDAERQIGAFVGRYNHRRYQESQRNLTRPTPISVIVRQSCSEERRSREGPSSDTACSISKPSHKPNDLIR